MDRSGVQRLCVLHKNVPGMLANITSLFGRDGVNVENLSNKSRGRLRLYHGGPWQQGG